MRSIAAFVIAGTHSGVGKTTIALGLMAALRRRGLKVQPFKVGPDFIDPGLHAVVTGSPSYNLDGWMLSRDYNRRSFRKNVRDKDVAVVEGMMGLYDGRSGATEEGSTAEMAKQLELPVILVVDASAMARSAAALVLGYRLFDRRVNLAGVIFNRVGGKGHVEFLRDALKTLPGLPCFGGLPFEEGIKIPERHLGLVTAEEKFFERRRADRLARWVETHLDLDALLKRSRMAVRSPAVERQNEKSSSENVSIAVARDKAFCFYYPDNLAALEAAGAKLKYFSPIGDRGLPAGTKGIYLGGGYPELYAGKLARNRSMRTAIRDFIEAGGPVYAECGGFMYLAKALIDGKNRQHPMVGVYPFKSKMYPTLRMLGYREVFFAGKSFLPAGKSARGHEFRYSELENSSTRARGVGIAYTARAAKKTERCAGYLYKNCVAGYAHLHFGSNRKFAEKFVQACQHWPA
jgi:cobyrinic acid a,c-diamide synthase